MKLTRVIAVSVIAAGMGVLSAPAQDLRDASPPAEFPPASFTGKQYVDSRGCIYIRAGIDGNVTWVPRVTRDRKQVCGYKPTAVAGTPAPAAEPDTPDPVEITVPAAKRKPKPLPEAVAKSEPAPEPMADEAGPEPMAGEAASKPAPAARPRPSAPARAATRRPPPAAATAAAPRKSPVIAPRETPAQASGPCPNASAFSQQYINREGVRCGPQAEPPITYGRGWDRNSAVRSRSGAAAPVSPDTRVVPRHVYDRRRNTNTFPVPEGYRKVWSDDRLNPHRAERTLRPAQPRRVAEAPPGYVRIERDDDRLNPQRGTRSARGDAQTDRIWTRTVPRTLVQPPTDRRVVTVPRDVAKSPAEAEPKTMRLSTRSAPASEQDATRVAKSAPDRYVRVATYDSDAQARRTAEALARSGLPMRLGSVRRGNDTRRVVLAGPFDDPNAARAALRQVRAAGFSGASLNK